VGWSSLSSALQRAAQRRHHIRAMAKRVPAGGLDCRLEKLERGALRLWQDE
jgi:hypothetical protein